MTNLIKSNFNEKIAKILQEQWTNRKAKVHTRVFKERSVVLKKLDVSR